VNDQYRIVFRFEGADAFVSVRFGRRFTARGFRKSAMKSSTSAVRISAIGRSANQSISGRKRQSMVPPPASFFANT